MSIMCELPFELGMYLKKTEFGVQHIDKISEYVIKHDGVYSILLLDALTDRARASVKIPVEDLLRDWDIVDEKEMSQMKDACKRLKR